MGSRILIRLAVGLIGWCLLRSFLRWAWGLEAQVIENFARSQSWFEEWLGCGLREFRSFEMCAYGLCQNF